MTKSLKSAKGREAAFELALDFDRALKQRGLNPGTSADLTVAVLFADYLGGHLGKAAQKWLSPPRAGWTRGYLTTGRIGLFRSAPKRG